MSALLDRPIWTALATCHAALAEGSWRARRYPAAIVPFGAAADGSPESLAALAALVGAEDRLLLIEAGEIALPPRLPAVVRAMGVQMLAERPFAPVDDPRIVALTDHDAEEMVALATLTKPGPFTRRAFALGGFWGISQGGRLVAMAGERFRQPGFTELSGVCTHPAAKGKGLATLLSRFVAARIQARGDVPYLHAYETNTRAIGLYGGIGFRLRCRMHVAAASRVDPVRPNAA